MNDTLFLLVMSIVQPGEREPDKGQAYKLPEPILVYKEEADGRKSWSQMSWAQQELITRSWETSIFLNSLVLYNDLSKLEKEEMLPDIMKSISKITLDLMRNELLLKELEKE